MKSDKIVCPACGSSVGVLRTSIDDNEKKIEWACSKCDALGVATYRFTLVSNEVSQKMKFFYTFGTDPAFPYKKGWVEVHAYTMQEADGKFRQRFPDRPGHEGILNCAFVYDEARWAKMDPEKNWPGWRCFEVIE